MSSVSVEAIQALVNRYFTALSQMNATAWLTLFADDATICDPVGTPPKLAHAESQTFFGLLTQFYTQLSVTPQSIFVGGNEAAVKWQMQVVAKNGKQATAEGISVFGINEAGQIQRVSSYWNESQLLAQLKG